MDPSYVGAIWLFGGNFQIYGFQFCNGQLTSISENTTLYTLLGTTYGGDGVQTFGLPDLRGRVPIGQGTGPGIGTFVIGQMSGNETATININTMPSHSHLINASSIAASTATPSSSLFFAGSTTGSPAIAETEYSTVVTTTGAMANNMIGASQTGGLPFEIIQPTLAATYVISMYGVYPSQN